MKALSREMKGTCKHCGRKNEFLEVHNLSSTLIPQVQTLPRFLCYYCIDIYSRAIFLGEKQIFELLYRDRPVKRSTYFF